MRLARKHSTEPDCPLEDIDIVELNEAFAAQSLAVIGELGIDTTKSISRAEQSHSATH